MGSSGGLGLRGSSRLIGLSQAGISG
jgi:hypothetical protein